MAQDNDEETGFMGMKIFSSAFIHGEEIPSRYTAEGKNISPPLAWTGVPLETESLVLIVDDPDAPDPAAPKMVWTHWVLYDIGPFVKNLPEGLKELPPGSGEGINDFKQTTYGGPNPPIGRHRYFFKLYALDTKLDFLRPPTRAEVDIAMQGHVLTQTILMGTYQLRKT